MLELLSNLPKEGKDLLSYSLDEIAREGARKLLIHALQLEVDDYVKESKFWKDDDGNQLVVRNGRSKTRQITVGSGTVEVKAPRVNDKRPGLKFTSNILPPYLRKSANVESILPILYLKGLSGNAFKDALKDLLGDKAGGLSKSSISALKKSWEKELKEWQQKPITDDYVYLWADGVHVNVRLGEDKKVCLLVIIGVNQNGEKHLLAVSSGFRESEIGWKSVLTNLVNRGLKSPLLMIGDGGLGLWSAMRGLEEFKNTKEQRCWVHKIANVLDKLPKSLQPKAKEALHEMMRAPSKSEAGNLLKQFKDVYEPKYPKSYECLNKGWSKITAFYDFPAEHWTSIRTSNPIESSFATVKLRTKVTKGAGSLKAAETMAFKLLREAEKKWRKIRGYQKIESLLLGDVYIDGILKHNKFIDQQEAV